MSSRFALPDGSIRGSVAVRASQFGNSSTQEVSLFTEPWRGALSIFINATGVAQVTLGNVLFRVYARTGGVRAMVRQFGYLERFPDVYPTLQWGSDPLRGKRDILVGRVTGIECDEIEVVALSLLTFNPTSHVPEDQFVLNYELRSTSPAPVDHSNARFYTWPVVPPAGPLETTKFQITAIGGNLHQLWAVNRAATDVWLYLFDSPGLSIGGGSQPRVPAIYVPPNGKGVASLDWGQAPLEALYGWVAAASSSPSFFTYDGAANLQIGAQIS